MSLAAHLSEHIINGSGLFDRSFYLVAGPDVKEAGRDPLDHFCRDGWREGRRPNLYFDPLWYRDRYLGGHASEENPLAHYIARGERAGYKPICYFDPAWYRWKYGLPRRSSPLRHFLANRRSQHFAPNRFFDLAFYLERHGAEIGANRDPFAHLLRYGATRDLDPSADFDSATYRRASMQKIASSVQCVTEQELRIPFVHWLEQSTRAPAADQPQRPFKQ